MLTKSWNQLNSNNTDATIHKISLHIYFSVQTCPQMQRSLGIVVNIIHLDNPLQTVYPLHLFFKFCPGVDLQKLFPLTHPPKVIQWFHHLLIMVLWIARIISQLSDWLIMMLRIEFACWRDGKWTVESSWTPSHSLSRQVRNRCLVNIIFFNKFLAPNLHGRSIQAAIKQQQRW